METRDRFVYVDNQLGAGGLEGDETVPPIGLCLGRDKVLLKWLAATRRTQLIHSQFEASKSTRQS
jgi:hypothetical protein